MKLLLRLVFYFVGYILRFYELVFQNNTKPMKKKRNGFKQKWKSIA